MSRSCFDTPPMLAVLGLAAVIASTAGVRPALADAATTPATPSAESTKKDDGSLTWKGITLYGTFDIGVATMGRACRS